MLLLAIYIWRNLLYTWRQNTIKTMQVKMDLPTKNLNRLNRIQRITMHLLVLTAIFLLSISNTAQAALSHEQSLTWQTLTSANFELHFHNGEQALAEKSLNIAERVLTDLQPTFDWIPKKRIEIILSDEFDASNGFVIAPYLPTLRITLFPTSPDNISDIDDWLELLITHELTHALHIDKAADKPLFLRKLFGRHPFSFPNILQPLWLIEGMATYLETDKAQENGRGQDDIFHMMMRMEVKRGIKSYEEINMPTTRWPVSNTPYLYGVHFFQFLESQYSRASINRFIADYSNNLTPFALNRNAMRTYGKTMPGLWVDFEIYLQNIYLSQLTKIATTDLKQGEQLTNNGYYKTYVQPLDNGNLIYAQYDGKTRPSLQVQKSEINKTEIIAEIRPEARLDYHPKAGVLVSQMEIYRNANYFYDIFKITIDDKNIQRLTRGDRYRRGVWNPSGDRIMALYNKSNKHTLALLHEDGQLIDLIWEGKEGDVIAGFDWSPDGQHLIASIRRSLGDWNIEQFSLEKRKWEPLIAGKENETQPQYSHDGERIVFSANYTGVYNIYEYQIKSKKISQITNVDGGAFRPILDKKGHLFYLGYTPNGYDVFKIEDTAAIQQPIQLQAAKQKTKKQYATVAFEKTDYTSFSNLSPTWWTPTFDFGVDNSNSISQVGGYVTGADALKIHTYNASVAFDIETSTVSGTIDYAYDRWFPLIQTHLSSIDRKEKTQRIYHLELLAPLLLREKRWFFGVAIRNETLKYKVNNNPAMEDNLLGFGSIYDTLKTNLISNSPSDGRVVSIVAETGELFGGDFNGKVLTAKWSEYIALKPEHVLALRFVTGLGLDRPRNFQLGGFFSDTNYFTVSPFSTTPFRSKFYNQRNYALRGYSATAPSLNGRRMMLYNAEWRFPLKRIEKTASALPIGLQQISGATFVESGAAWNDGIKPINFRYSIGAEVKVHTNIFYAIFATLRAGYAYGAGEGGEHQFYLNYGSSF